MSGLSVGQKIGSLKCQIPEGWGVYGVCELWNPRELASHIPVEL